MKIATPSERSYPGLSPMIFENRKAAGEALAKRLQPYREKGALVLALPRGGVVVGAVLAERLALELDVLLIKKLGAPDNPELAVGAITETGKVYLNERVVSFYGAIGEYLEREKKEALAVLAERSSGYRKVRPKASVEGRVVIIVDDGVATGATVISAIEVVEAEGARRVIVALPVGPPETISEIAHLADEVHCLYEPLDFGAVGQFYSDFRETPDSEVLKILSRWGKGS